jgi:hypothetical protein
VSVDLNSVGVTLKPGFYGYSLSATSTGGSTEAHGGSFEPPLGVLDPPGSGVSPLSGGGGQPAASGNGDQAAGPGSSSSSPTPGVGVLGTQAGKTIKLKSLTNAQKRAKALKVCEKKSKSKRAACEKQAHRKYGTAALKAKKG